MDILTTGEKIKRARIQKDMTLKDLCGKEISVSKLSTIENSKVQAEEWILKLIAKRLNLDVEYLKKDMVQEISDELKRLDSKRASGTYEDEVRDLISIANQNGLYSQAFMARLQLIDYFMAKNKTELLTVEISNLYKTLIRVVNKETLYLYIYTMAKYLIYTREYYNAAVYLQNLMDHFNELPVSMTDDVKLQIPYMLMQCYVYTRQYERASKYAASVKALMEKTNSKVILGEIHLLFYILSTTGELESDAAADYSKVNKYLEDYPEQLATAKFILAINMIESGKNREGYRELEKAAEIFPKEKLGESTELLMSAMEIFAENKLYDEADKYIDMLVNSAIENGDTDFMQKAYYYKGMLLGRKGKYDQAETYMSVSLDLLMKKGRSKELSDRYKDLGKIYYQMGNKQEAIKYLSMSVSAL
jgi:transcriptional regulator with XRE-family HTH domain